MWLSWLTLEQVATIDPAVCAALCPPLPPLPPGATAHTTRLSGPPSPALAGGPGCHSLPSWAASPLNFNSDAHKTPHSHSLVKLQALVA